MQELLKYRNLEEAIKGVGSPVKMLRNSALGLFAFPGVPPEYSNWKDEQRAWINDVALLNLSFHMTHSYLKGPGALDFFRHLACNKLGSFPINQAKQLIVTGNDGYLIGDGIVFHTSDDVYRVSGAPMASDWLQFQAESGRFDIQYSRQESMFVQSGDPRLFIYQITGPHAAALAQDVCDGELPQIKFFHIGEFTISGKKVRALRHGMATAPGFEIFGAWEDHKVVLGALEEAGQKYHLKKVGALAYPSTCIESGWLGTPIPAIYDSADMKSYREWMTPAHLEVMGSLGGSFVSDNIADYYIDPIEWGCGSMIDLERNFIGRDKLAEKMKSPKRKKVTFVLNHEDVARTISAAMFDKDRPAKSMEMPVSNYSTFQYDSVTKNGKPVGLSLVTGANANANEMLSLGIVDLQQSEPGTEVELLWGEPNSTRPTVERNVLYTIRAKVAPAPYFSKANKSF